MKINRIAVVAATTVAAALAVSAYAANTQKAGPAASEKEGQKVERRAHRGGCGGKFFKAMGDKLGLTEDQKAKIKAIKQDSRQKAKLILGNDSILKEAKKEQLKQLRETTKTQVQQVLTPEQKAQIEKWRQEHQQKRAERKKSKAARQQA